MDNTERIHTNRNKKFCPKCGALTELGAKFCPKCGINLNNNFDDNQSNYYQNPNQSIPPKESRIGTGFIIAISIGVIAIILLLIYLFVFSPKSKTDEVKTKESNELVNSKLEKNKQEAELKKLKEEAENLKEENRKAEREDHKRKIAEKEKEINDLRKELENKPTVVKVPVQEVTLPSTNQAVNSVPTSNSSYIFPNSNNSYISWSDLDNLSKSDIEYARNEIYARRGYIFKEQQFRDYFNSKSWYVPNSNFHDGMFNSVEKANIETIVAYEKNMGWR